MTLVLVDLERNSKIATVRAYSFVCVACANSHLVCVQNRSRVCANRKTKKNHVSPPVCANVCMSHPLSLGQKAPKPFSNRTF